MSSHIRGRALVLGGGMAGLLAARVLSESYTEVVIVDRDRIDGHSGPRRGVPHGRHAHALLARGGQIIEGLFPGLQESLTDAGVPAGDLAGNLRWYFNGRRLAQKHSGLLSVSATRPVLEEAIRRRVLAIPAITLMQDTIIRGLVTTPDNARVTGVSVIAQEAEASEQVVEADLVVDATGRGSRMPAWLVALGYAAPAEDKVKIDMAYTTRHFRLRRDPYGHDLSINPVASPAHPRGAFFPKIDGDLSMLSLTGILGDHPPTDPEGFMAFVRSLPTPEIHDAIHDAEPVDQAVSFRVAASVRRRFEKLTRFPRGLLVIGDGICAFNPVYGQGMTAAAVEADALRTHLVARDGAEPDAMAFFRAITPLVDIPWEISTGGDLGFPGVEGPRTLKVRFGNAFMSRLHAAATNDPEITAAFFKVAGLVAPMESLMAPSMVARVLRNRHLRPESLPPAPVTTFDGDEGLAAA